MLAFRLFPVHAAAGSLARHSTMRSGDGFGKVHGRAQTSPTRDFLFRRRLQKKHAWLRWLRMPVPRTKLQAAGRLVDKIPTSPKRRRVTTPQPTAIETHSCGHRRVSVTGRGRRIVSFSRVPPGPRPARALAISAGILVLPTHACHEPRASCPRWSDRNVVSFATHRGVPHFRRRECPRSQPAANERDRWRWPTIHGGLGDKHRDSHVVVVEPRLAPAQFLVADGVPVFHVRRGDGRITRRNPIKPTTHRASRTQPAAPVFWSFLALANSAFIAPPIPPGACRSRSPNPNANRVVFGPGR